MTKRLFSAANNYRGLEEAIDTILNEEEDLDLSYDLVAIPPDPSILTDEEEGDEDDVQQNVLPRDIPGTVEVFQFRNNDEWDSSDDEPLQRYRRIDIQEPRWRKCDGTYDGMPSMENNVQKRKEYVVNMLKDNTPINIFEKIFDVEVIEMIILNTKLYAAQHNNHDFQITVEDLKVFFGILLLTGYHSLPRERLYWSLDEDCIVTIVSKAMSKNRFVDIKKFLHFCDNEAAATSTDKMFKVRPLADLLIKKFLQWGVFHEHLSIDESMVKYFGRHPAKQFIRGKPVRFGYKNWMITSADGYCYGFDIYCGKSVGSTTNEPLGSKVVKNLLQKVNAIPHEHIVYFDNFFTSHALLRDLRETGYRATGTIRENRTKKCPLVSIKDMKKKNRAEFDYRFDTVNQILFVRWLDNSVCTMGTNYDFVYPLGKVKRWSSAERRKVDVDIPFVFQNYNKGMGGVDQADQSIALYRSAIRGKKWWWILFTYMLDLAVANAWRLHVLTAEEKLDQLQFRRSIARFYLRGAGTDRHDGRRRKPSSAVPSMSQDGVGHFPQKLPSQLRCIVCHMKARWQCKKCIKTLCIEKECFEKYHT